MNAATSHRRTAAAALIVAAAGAVSLGAQPGLVMDQPHAAPAPAPRADVPDRSPPTLPVAPRGLAGCPDIVGDMAACQTANLALPANFSSGVSGGFRVIDNVTPAATNPARLCWLGRYANRALPAVADESFQVRIFADVAGFPDLIAGPVFERTFLQSGTPGVDQLQMDCLDGQFCPGTTSPASGGHLVYSIEVGGGLPMTANGCYWIEIACIGSAAAGLQWGWSASEAGNDAISLQAVDAGYTLRTRVAHDRAMCLTGGVIPAIPGCTTAPVPPICANPDVNGILYEPGSSNGYRSSSPSSIGNPSGPNAWVPFQRAENFQVSDAAAVSNVCFRGFYTGGPGQLPPAPDWDIAYFASVDGAPGGPVPIASFRVGTTPGVTADTDGEESSVTHPPVNLLPGVCYWLSISRVQGSLDGTGMLWHWSLTTGSGAAADDVLASRGVSGPVPGPWELVTISPSFPSNLVFLLNAGPLSAPVCGDCNGNGIPDAQEITSNAALDCYDRAATFGRGEPDGLLDSCQCRADWNRDGVVNSGDLSAYIKMWLIDVQGHLTPADMTCDGVTNSTDISTFISIWLGSAAGATPLDGCP